MSAMASPIIGILIVYSTVCWSADQRKHQSSASLAFVRGILRWPVNSPHKGPVTRNMFPVDDVIMLLVFWWEFKPGLYSMRAYARVYARIRRLSAQLFILLSPVAPSAYARIRRLSPSKFKHVELSRPAQTSAGIPANHESAPRSPRADALLCLGTYADVYRRIRSPIYTFIHGATCAMQWRCVGSHKRGHLRRLSAHTRAWSINPA